jgi:hemin uptake protein HemP
MTPKSNSPAPQPPAEADRLKLGPVLESEQILGGATEVLIRHEGRIYRLRRTRLGKLILTA